MFIIHFYRVYYLLRSIFLVQKDPSNYLNIFISWYLGDDFYPSKDDLDVQGTRPAVTHKFTIDEAREMSANYHRLEFRTLYDCTVRCNICLPCGHVRPVTNLVV